jgi:hypothetical protein
MQDELGLNAGQLIRMLHEYDDGWVSSISLSFSSDMLIVARHSASAWIALSKVLSLVLACPSTPSSLAPLHHVKARHPQVCAALLSAHQWVPAAFLSLVRSRLPAVVIRPTLPASHPTMVACPLALAL